MPLTADVPLNEVVYFDFITSRFDTGAVTDADSTPTFEVFEEATDTDIGIGGNATKRTSKTGNYRVTFTCSAANGFEVGKWYSVVASATVNGVGGKAVIGTFRLVAAEGTAGKPKVDVDLIEGSDATDQIRDSVVSDATRLAGGDVATIKAKTDNLPSDPADASDIAAAFVALNDVSVADIVTALVATLHSGVAQGDGGAGNKLQLAAAAVGSDDEFNGYLVAIVAGAGKGQQRQVLDTVNATDTIEVVGGDWETPVDNTSVYILFAN
jgi:hypothetical protein